MIQPTESFNGISLTINSTTDCNLRCKYDLPAGTKILMSDFSEKNIEDVKTGDKIIGFTENPKLGKFRKFEYATVEAAGPTRKLIEAYAYKTYDGNTVLIASGEHPVVNQRNKFVTTKSFFESNEKEKRILKVRKHSDGIDRHGYYDRVPIKIEKISIPETQFYNLTTTSRTFIANGIYVHNCYELNKRSLIIDENVVYKFIDRVLEDPDPIGAKGTSDQWISNVGCILDFIGGDSFMQPEIMDKALSYFQYKANKMNHPYAKNWRASISTNGTLFADPKVQALIEKYGDNLSIGVSIDGCPEVHDANRIFTVRGKNGEELGTMSTIMKWWPWLRERQPDATNHTKSTCSKNSIPWLYKSLKFMHEPYPEGLGITYVNQNFIMEDTGCEEEDYILLDEMFRKCTKYLWDRRHEMYWSMFDKMGLNHRSDNVADFNSSIKKGWCGSGAMPSLGLNGKIYPCFRWLPHTMEDLGDADTMCVGNVEEGFTHKENFRRVKEASREKISSQYCLECEFEGACAYCIGGCYAENHAFKRTEHICFIAKLRSKWARRYWDMLEEEEHNGDDYFTTDSGANYTMRENDYVENRDSVMRWGADGKIKPEFRTPDNPTGEAPLRIPDLPEESRDAWKYRPKRVVQEGEEIYNEKSSMPVNNVGEVTLH